MHKFLRRLTFLVRRRRFEADLAEEMAFHRAMTGARAFGSAALARDRSRDVWLSAGLRDIARDISFAARLLRKDAWFTAVAAVALALAMAAATTVYTVVNAMVLRGLPVPHPDRIVAVNDAAGAALSVSYRDLEDWRAASTLAGVAAHTGAPGIVADEGRSPESFAASYVSANAFPLLEETPILGRGFVAADDRPGAPLVVILGYKVWTGRYEADPAVIGRTIRVNNVPAVVVGVMATGFRFPLVQDLWMPLGTMPGLVTDRRDMRQLQAFGRLSDRAAIGQAQAEIGTMAARLAREYPETNKDMRPVIAPFTGRIDHPMFVALFGAVAFVVLVACANVASLLLARASRRSREISVRIALGATRWRVVRQLLVESTLLAFLAGVLGLALATACVRLFAYSVSGINFAYWYNERWTMDGRVLTFAAAVCLGTVFAFGLLPALHLSKTDVNDDLKQDMRTGAGGAGSRVWTAALLVTELAFTLTLLAGAGFMTRSFLAIYRADLTVDTANLSAMFMRLPQKYSTPEQRLTFYQRIEQRFASTGTVSSASIVSTIPFIGAPMWRLAIVGQPSFGTPPGVSFVRVGTRYLETLGLGLVRGRAFTDSDGSPGHESAIVTQRLVDMFFAGDDPLGRWIELTNPAVAGAKSLRVQIVGVSPTVRQQFLAEIDPVVFLPFRTNATPNAMLMVRGRPDAGAIASVVRAELRALDPDLPVGQVTPVDEFMGQSRWGHRVFGIMFSLFAMIALALSAVGLYAVTAYAVTQRTHEIGVRMALGASARHVVWLFVRRGMIPLVVGVSVGLAGAFGVGRLIQGMLVRTSPADPVTLVSIVMLLACVSVSACFWPARRAARLDPVTALRHE